MRRYSPSMIFKKMYIKAIGRHHYSPNRLAKIKRTVLHVVKDIAQPEFLYTVGQRINSYNCFEKL